MARTLATAILLFSLLLVGCVRREGRNSDCQWTKPTGGDQHDLRGDLEFAEDLAVRYMEAHAGPRDPSLAAKAKNHCMSILLVEIGKEHGKSAREVFQSFGRRSTAIDLMMNLPFLLLCVLAGNFGARLLLLRYPPSDSGIATVLMIALASIAFGTAGLLLGQQWASMAESIRVGTTHLSNRIFRLPINQHPIAVFTSLAVLFLCIAFVRYRFNRDSRTTAVNRFDRLG